jgi:hypothetical protein
LCECIRPRPGSIFDSCDQIVANERLLPKVGCTKPHCGACGLNVAIAGQDDDPGRYASMSKQLKQRQAAKVREIQIEDDDVDARGCRSGEASGPGRDAPDIEALSNK